jgi:hypothetical protein
MDEAIPLITVDPALFPHVCLLSRAQLDADDAEILAAIHSHHTREHLARTHTAGMIVVVDDSAHYVKLAVDRHISFDKVHGYAFRVVGHKMDRTGEALVGMQFFVSSQLPIWEDWETSGAVLTRLSGDVSGDVKQDQ